MIRLFRVFFPASVLGLLLSEFALLYLCFTAAVFFTFSFVAPESEPQTFFSAEGGAVRIALVVSSVMLGLYFNDLYAQLRVKSRIQLVQQFCLVLGIAFLVQAFLSYLKLPELILPKYEMITGSCFTLLLVPAWRMFYSAVLLRAFGQQRVLFLGASPVAQEIAAHLTETPELGLVSLGFIDDASEGKHLQGGKVLAKICDLDALVQDLRPDRIVVGMTERRQKLPVNDLLRIRFSGVHIEDSLHLYEVAFGRVCTRELRPSQLVFTSELGPRANSALWHSLYSFLIALVLTVIALPIMLLVAIAVKLSSPGPVLYGQRRVGFNDVPFIVYKFRSMYVDAEARTGAVWAKKNDPRITPVGRFIRKARLDELPQLFNVLRGEMSIVGPRPERPEFVKTLTDQIPYYRQRHCVKPGITGWAQINHKYGDTLEDTVIKLEYDLYYIKNLALSLDTYIMFQTVKVMLLSRGAQ